MYVSRLRLQNIKCFDDFSIDFRSAGGVGSWALILGDNGVGKSTILRSIAMSLSGSTSPLADVEVEWLKVGKKL